MKYFILFTTIIGILIHGLYGMPPDKADHNNNQKHAGMFNFNVEKISCE